MSDKFKIKKSERNNIARAFGLGTQIGIQMIVIIAGSILLGHFLDQKLGTSPWLLLVLLVLGLAAAFRSMYSIAMTAVPGGKRAGKPAAGEKPVEKSDKEPPRGE